MHFITTNSLKHVPDFCFGIYSNILLQYYQQTINYLFENLLKNLKVTFKIWNVTTKFYKLILTSNHNWETRFWKQENKVISKKQESSYVKLNKNQVSLSVPQIPWAWEIMTVYEQ